MKAIAFAKQVLLFTPKAGPWADDLEQLILDPKGGSFNSNDREWTRLVGDWGGWRFRTVGAVRSCYSGAGGVLPREQMHA